MNPSGDAYAPSDRLPPRGGGAAAGGGGRGQQPARDGREVHRLLDHGVVVGHPRAVDGQVEDPGVGAQGGARAREHVGGAGVPGLRGGGGEARGRAEARGGAAGGRAGAEAGAATEAAAAGAFEGDAVGELRPEAAVARRGGVLCVFSGLVCVGRQ